MNNNEENNKVVSPVNFGPYPQTEGKTEETTNVGEVSQPATSSSGIGSLLQTPVNEEPANSTIPEPVQPVIPQPILTTPQVVEQSQSAIQPQVDLNPQPPVVEQTQNIIQPQVDLNPQPATTAQSPNIIQPEINTIPQPPVVEQPQNVVQPDSATQSQPMVSVIAESSDSQTSGNAANQSIATNEKPPILMIIITVLVVLGVAVFLFLYLTGKINFGGNAGGGNDVVDTGEDTVDTSWVDYVINSDITEIKLYRTTMDGTGNAEVTLTKDDLTEIFGEFANLNLTEEYVQNVGYTHGDMLSITYQKDDVSYIIRIGNNRFWFGEDYSLIPTDSDLLVALESSATIDEENADLNGASRSFSFESLNNSLYDKYYVTSSNSN